MNKITKNQLIFVWGVLALPLLSFIVFYWYVNINSILLAFRNIDYAKGGIEYWTLDNFKEVFHLFKGEVRGSDFKLYGLNTLKFWLLSALWDIPFCVLMTYAFFKNMLGHKFFRVILYIPAIISAVALTGIFSSIIDTNGAFGYMLENVFHVSRVPSWFQEAEYVLPALMFYSWFFSMAGSYVVYSGAIASIPREIFEAAHMDGVTMWQEIRYICVPLMWPTISVTVLNTFIGIFNASGPNLLLAPEMKEAWSLGYWIFDQVNTYNSYYVPSALGLCFTIIMFPIAILIKRIVNNMFTVE